MTKSLITISTIIWSTGEAFDGFLILAIGKPTSSGTSWTGISLNSSHRQHPTYILAVIKNGLLEHPLKIIPTTLLSPPGCRYYFYWFDSAGKQVFPTPPTLPTAVNITADYTLTQPTLTAPTISTISPAVETTIIQP